MNQAAIHALARRAGVAVDWTDYANQPHRVATEILARVLEALGLPCRTADELAHSEKILAGAASSLVTATAGKSIQLTSGTKIAAGLVRLIMEDGTSSDLKAVETPSGLELPAIATPGYHALECGDGRITLAVAPQRCVTIGDILPDRRIWGVAAQIYGLRRDGDCGIGDAAAAAALAKTAAARHADALALSPIHALFTADPGHFSPYSPSNRLFYNPLYADPRTVFGAEVVAKAADQAGVGSQIAETERRTLIDWPKATRVKLSVLRRLFADFTATDLASGGTRRARDFAGFCAAGGELLEDHARFETLHAQMLRNDPPIWSWMDWPPEWRNPHGPEVKIFAQRNAGEIMFHRFLQWIADRSFAAAQHAAKAAGMRIGLIGDLAVGMSGAGSQAWTSQADMLAGLEIGAPPDLYNSKGQNWGLTTFSPRALLSGGFAPFIATLRACLRHAGGLRIDHVMGLLRLWVVPRGAEANDGAYLSYPIGDLLRLVALESYRHRAIIIGEDLGTVPEGFRDMLASTGIYGMRVLWFERDDKRFAPPRSWSADAAAMTSTHDLPTVAGWWRGHDIEARQQLGLVTDAKKERDERKRDRRLLWQAFRRARAAVGAMPAPEETPAVVDASVRFTAQTPSEIALLPLEDILGLDEQPNLPGTINQHPNWRRRYPGEADKLLSPVCVQQTLAPLAKRSKE